MRNQHGALAMGRERDSLVFFRCHNKATRVSCSTAPPPSGVPATTFQPRGSILLQKAHCAAMLDAACCDDHRSTLSRHMHRVAFSGQRFPSVRRADPTVQLDLGHRPYSPAHASCIFCFIGAKNTTDVSAHSSPLSKENTPDHQQVTPLCSKKTPRSASKSQSFVQRSSTNSLRVPLHRP